jgi:trans-aconitate methyltransferase
MHAFFSVEIYAHFL